MNLNSIDYVGVSHIFDVIFWWHDWDMRDEHSWGDSDIGDIPFGESPMVSPM